MSYNDEKDIKDALHDEHVSSHTNLKPISNMEIHENKDAFRALKEELDWGTPIVIDFTIRNRCPYYKFFSTSAQETKSLHLNKQILNHIYNYFEGHNIGNVPTDYVGVETGTNLYLLHLLKRDRQNGKLSHEPWMGYKAIYNNITINYGQFNMIPYTTPEELYAGLDAL